MKQCQEDRTYSEEGQCKLAAQVESLSRELLAIRREAVNITSSTKRIDEAS